MKKTLTILALLFATATLSFPQASTGGINVTATLVPPYSLKLSDYPATGSQKLMVQLHVTDLTRDNYPVKLRFKMETMGVTIENPPTINTAPIFLDGGASYILFGKDLADYFNIDNLVFKGYSKQDYNRTGQLPEGFWRFTVEVLDFRTNRAITGKNPGKAAAWITLGKPPVLREPQDNAGMGEFRGMPLTFSWSASNVGSPASAGSIQYRFEMWELRIQGINPNTVIASTPVFHEHTTSSSLYSLIPSSLLMESGMAYAWRVTAFDVAGLVPFEQDGHSEVRTFTYKSKCDSITGLKAESRSTTGLFTWDAATNHTAFNVELENVTQNSKHYSETFDSKLEYVGLKRGNTYKVRIQGVCDSDPESTSDFSHWARLAIPEAKPLIDTSECPDCGCGTDIPQSGIDNFELRRDLQAGDTIENKSGRTRFIIKSIDQQNGDTYSGQFLFWAEVWGLKIRCNYENLQVNTDNVVVNMDFESVYDPKFLLDVDKAKELIDKGKELVQGAGDALAGATMDIKDTIEVAEDMASIFVNEGGNIVAVDENGNETPLGIDADGNKKTLIRDKDGNEYVIDRDGNVMGKAEYAATNGGGNGSGAARRMEDYKAKKETEDLSENATVNFARADNQKYGLDAYDASKEQISSRYQLLKEGYRVGYKSIESFMTDVVAHSPTAQNATITFKDEMGIPALENNGQVTLRGGTGGSELSLYAYQQVNDSTERIAGKLNLASFNKVRKKLYVISVNGASTPTAQGLQDDLNDIYKQAVVEWDVARIETPLTVNFDDGQFTHGGSNDFTVYNKDQKAVAKAFEDAGNQVEKDALYLFYVNNVDKGGEAVGGYMPLQYNIGFIYEVNNRTVAHELAHGAFNLTHTFSNMSGSYGYASQTATKNLMSYNPDADATELWHDQWGLIHDPQNKLFAWAQDEEEGESKFTIIDDAYTDLFNYMYENYIEASKLEITDMSGYDGKGYFKNWKLNTNDFNATSILEQIRNTATNSQIPDLTLTEKQIAPSTVFFNDKNIPIVVYCPIGKVSGVTKNWYTDVDAFNNSKFYYCEERVADDYIVLALYVKEADHPLSPALILQMEDDEFNLKEKWLQDLLILEPKKPDATPLNDADLKLLFPSLTDAEQEILDDRKNYWAYVSTNMKTLFADCKGKDVTLDYYDNKKISASSHTNTGKQMITSFKEGVTEFKYYNKVYINTDFEAGGVKYDIAAHNFGGTKTYNAANRPTIKSLEDLSNARLIKSVTTPNYVLIAFYETEGSDPFIVYQVNGTDGGIKEAWLNYFNIVENEEKVEDLIETIVDAQDEDYKGIVDLEKKLTNESVFARDFEIEDKKFDVYIERSGKVEDDKSKIYLFTTEEKTKIFGFDGEYTSFTLTNNSGGITKLSVPTTQAKDFVALVLKPELGHAANIRAICERVRQGWKNGDKSVSFENFDAIHQTSVWSPCPNVKLGQTVFDFKAYQIYSIEDKKIVFWNIEETLANDPEKYGMRIVFKNSDYEEVISLNIKKEQFDAFKEYLFSEKFDKVMLTDVTWVSQLDANLFGSYSCFDDVACCFVASNKILEYSGVSTTRSQQVVIVSSNDPNCGILTATNNYEKGLKIIHKSLDEHKLPILIGVHHPYQNKKTFVWYNKCSGNTPSVTNHYIVIVGKGYDEVKRKNYFRFYEVGTSHENYGKSDENKLFIEDNNLIIGKTKYVNKEEYFTVTEVRKNIGQEY